MPEQKTVAKFVLILILSQSFVQTALFGVTPAGTRIIGEASVEFIWNGNRYFITSNVVVTQVLPVYKVEVIPDGRIGEPSQVRWSSVGVSFHFHYILINRGNVPDDYQLSSLYSPSASSFEPQMRRIYWDVNGNGIIDPGESNPIGRLTGVPPNRPIHLILVFESPLSAVTGDSAWVTLAARSLNSGELDSDNWGLAIVSEGPVIHASKSSTPPIVNPNDTITYTINFVNDGNGWADTVVVTDWIDTNGCAMFTRLITNSIHTSPNALIEYYDRENNQWTPIPPGNSEAIGGVRATFHQIAPTQHGTFRFSVVVDSTAPETTIYNYTIVSWWDNIRQIFDTVLTNNAINRVDRIPDVQIGPFGNSMALPGGEGSWDDVQYLQEVRRNSWVSFRNTIRNNGDVPAFVELGFNAEGLGLSRYSLEVRTGDGMTNLFDGNGNGYFDIGELRPGDSTTVSFFIWVGSDSSAVSDTAHDLWVFVFPLGEDSLRNWTLNRFGRIVERAPAQLTLNKSVSPDTVINIGEAASFTIDFENSGEVTLTDVNIYDPIDTLFSDPFEFTDGLVEDVHGRFAPIRASASYSEATRILSWHFDSIPVGFAGRLNFNVQATTELHADEAVAENLASATADQLPMPDTSNRLFVHIVTPILSISKHVAERSAEIGDPLHYTVRVENNSDLNTTLYDARIFDRFPKGVRFVEGSARLNGEPISPTRLLANGVEFQIDSLIPGVTYDLSYIALVGPGASYGNAVNSAVATAYMPSGTPVHAGPAKAVVKIVEGFATERGIVFGKVFIDENENRVQDEGERGVPGVIVILDDGTYAVTDSAGRYSITGVLPGLHIARIDPTSLPDGVAIPPITSEFLGSPGSQIFELPKSANYKVNFRLIPKIQLVQRREDSVELRKEAKVISEGGEIKFTLPTTYFETAKADLKPDAPVEEFKKIGMFLASHPDWRAKVEGHTDPRPIHTREFPDNYALSKARAQTVANELIKYGARPEQLEVVGYGPDRPKVPNTSEWNMAINRRVEVILYPVSAQQEVDVVRYTITLHNGRDPLKGVTVVDVLPRGGEVVENLISSTHSGTRYSIKDTTIVFYIGDVAPNEEIVLSYDVKIEEGERAAKYFNRARVFYEWGEVPLTTPDVSVVLKREGMAAENTIVLRSQSDILFKTGKADLRPEAEPYLNRILELLRFYPDATARIEGHTDPRPIHTDEFPSNWELSEARAKAVYDWLVQHGVSENRLSYQGFADTKPIVPNTSPMNMQLNRRVDVIIEREGGFAPPVRSDTATLTQVDLTVYAPLSKYRNGFIEVQDVLEPDKHFVKNSAKAGKFPIPDPKIDGNVLTFRVPIRAISDTFHLTYLISETPGLKITASEALPDTSGLKYTQIQVPQIISPKENELIRQGLITRVRVAVPIEMPFELYLNGERVPNSALGMTKKDAQHGIAIYEFVGLRLKPGKNVLKLRTYDQNSRYVELERVFRASGPPKEIRLSLVQKEIHADGVTSPLIVAEVVDSLGLQVMDGVVVNFDVIGIEAQTRDERLNIPGIQTLTKDGVAKLVLVPSLTPKKVKVIAWIETDSDTLEVVYLPATKKLIAFGGFDVKAGMYRFADSDSSKREATTVATFFARGPIYHDIVVTAAARYDPYLENMFNRDEQRYMFGQIPPESFYPTLGDASKVERLAPSRKGVFLRLDKGLSFVQYGDFRSDFGGSNFARYDRALTGGLAHIESQYFELDGFVAPDRQVVKADTFRANGTPGYFYLTSIPIISNSEEVFIVTLDRLHPELVVSRRKLERFSDYTLNPITGALLLKAPVPSFDNEFNPNYIVVIYEVEGESDRMVYGGHAAVKFGSSGKLGVLSSVSGRGTGRQLSVLGAYIKEDLRWLKIDAELSTTQMSIGLADTATADKRTGKAFTGSITVNPTSALSFKLHYTRMDSNYINPTSLVPTNTSASEDIGFEARAALPTNSELETKGFRRWLGEREVNSAELVVNQKLGEKLKLGVGYRTALERMDTSTTRSDMAVTEFGANPLQNLSLNLRHEQKLKGGELAEVPPRTVAQASFGITQWAKLTGEWERRWSESFGGDRALVGIEIQPTANIKTYSRYRMENIGTGEHNQAIFGLDNTIPITEKLKVGLNGEYVHDFRNSVLSHTSLGFAVEYLAQSFKGSARYSFHSSSAEKTHLFELSGGIPVGNDFSLIFKENLMMRRVGGVYRTRSEGFVGFAYRPISSDWLNLFGVVRHLSPEDTALPKKVIASLDWHLQPFVKLRFFGRVATKFVFDKELSEAAKTHLVSVWLQYDFVEDRLYAAAGTRSLLQPQTSSAEHDASVEIGVIIKQDMMLGVGYNFRGVSENSWSEDEDWKKGFYVRFRTKVGGMW